MLHKPTQFELIAFLKDMLEDICRCSLSHKCFLGTKHKKENLNYMKGFNCLLILKIRQHSSATTINGHTICLRNVCTSQKEQRQAMF